MEFLQSGNTFFTQLFLYVWTVPLIPSISYTKIVNGQVKMISLKQLQWRYWITALMLGFATYHRFFVIYYMQRSLNVHREACLCDATRALSKISPVEALFLRFGNTDLTQQYLICRETCP